MHSIHAKIFIASAFAGMLLLARVDAAEEPQPTALLSEAERAVRMVPTKIEATYQGGELLHLTVHERMAYLVKPTGKVDAQKRWLWEFPFWLGVNDGFGNLQHRIISKRRWPRAFTSRASTWAPGCASPAAAKVCQEFYERLVADYGLAPRARIMGQSHGGLIAYGWAFRHPTCVERIAGICPATDFRSWPGLANTINFPAKGFGYDLSPAELPHRAAEFNPIDNLAPLAKAGVKILHIHGDKDTLVPMSDNSTELSALSGVGGHGHDRRDPGPRAWRPGAVLHPRRCWNF